MIVEFKTPDHKILALEVPDGSRQRVGFDIDGNKVFDKDILAVASTGRRYVARLLPKVVEMATWEKDFVTHVDSRALVREDKLPDHKPIMYSGREVHTKKIVIGELQCRDNGVRTFRGDVKNALENLILNCFTWYIVDSEGAHQVSYESIQKVEGDGKS